MEDLFLYIQDLKEALKDKILEETRTDDNVVVMELNTIINKFELAKLKRMKKDSITLESAVNKNLKKTFLSIWENEMEMDKNL